MGPEEIPTSRLLDSVTNQFYSDGSPIGKDETDTRDKIRNKFLAGIKEGGGIGKAFGKTGLNLLADDFANRNRVKALLTKSQKTETTKGQTNTVVSEAMGAALENLITLALGKDYESLKSLFEGQEDSDFFDFKLSTDHQKILKPMVQTPGHVLTGSKEAFSDAKPNLGDEEKKSVVGKAFNQNLPMDGTFQGAVDAAWKHVEENHLNALQFKEGDPRAGTPVRAHSRTLASGAKVPVQAHMRKKAMGGVVQKLMAGGKIGQFPPTAGNLDWEPDLAPEECESRPSSYRTGMWYHDEADKLMESLGVNTALKGIKTTQEPKIEPLQKTLGGVGRTLPLGSPTPDMIDVLPEQSDKIMAMVKNIATNKKIADAARNFMNSDDYIWEDLDKRDYRGANKALDQYYYNSRNVNNLIEQEFGANADWIGTMPNEQRGDTASSYIESVLKAAELKILIDRSMKTLKGREIEGITSEEALKAGGIQPETTTLWSGFMSSRGEQIEAALGLQPGGLHDKSNWENLIGREFSLKGFLSTSTNRNATESFFSRGKAGSGLLRINTKPTFEGADLRELDEFENEILLPSLNRFRIDRIDEEANFAPEDFKPWTPETLAAHRASGQPLAGKRYTPLIHLQQLKEGGKIAGGVTDKRQGLKEGGEPKKTGLLTRRSPYRLRGQPSFREIIPHDELNKRQVEKLKKLYQTKKGKEAVDKYSQKIDADLAAGTLRKTRQTGSLMRVPKDKSPILGGYIPWENEETGQAYHYGDIADALAAAGLEIGGLGLLLPGALLGWAAGGIAGQTVEFGLMGIQGAAQLTAVLAKAGLMVSAKVGKSIYDERNELGDTIWKGHVVPAFKKFSSLLRDDPSLKDVEQDPEQSGLPEAAGFQAAAKGGKVQRFAKGGGVGTDTVPALLTPGEFVINKKAAQSVGYGKLNHMNDVGKFATGGVVGFQAGGGVGAF